MHNITEIIDGAFAVFGSLFFIFILSNKKIFEKISNVFISTMMASGEKQEMLNKAQINLTQILFGWKYEEIEKQGYCSTHDKNRLTIVYADYKKIGGNSFVDDMYEKIMAMSTEAKKKRKKR